MGDMPDWKIRKIRGKRPKKRSKVKKQRKVKEVWNNPKFAKKYPDEVDVIPGDILIHKEWGKAAFKGGVAGKIRVGQAIFSHVEGGSMDSEHFAICVWGGNIPLVIEAADTCLALKMMDLRDKLVFRATDNKLRNEAVNVAARLAGLDNPVGSKHLVAPYYAAGKAVKSLFKSRHLMKWGKAYLKEIYGAVYGPADGSKKRCEDLFCSEFVATCYEVAAKRLKTSALGFDPRALSPKAMEGQLKKPRFKKRFELKGRAKITPKYKKHYETTDDECPFCDQDYVDCEFECGGYDD